MFKHRKLIVFTVLVMTLILSIGAISAADDTSTSDMDNSNYHTTSESITNENLVSDTQDNNMKQSTPKSIKTDTDNTISINKDNYREHGWIKEEVEGKYALSYNGEQNPGNVTFIFEDTIDENLNSIALLNTNNTAITANPDVEFNNIAFTLEGTNNVTLKDLKINIDENYVYTWIYNPNIIHVDSESTATTIDNVHMNCYLPPSTELPHRFNVLDIQSGAEIIDSEFIIETYSSEVDWSQGSEYYGTNQIMPIRTRGESSVNFKNNMIYINATNNNTQFPTLYGITFETPYSIISDNYMEIHGNGWLYAINIKADYCNVTNNEIIVTGTNYTGGIFIQDHSYNLVDNNTITLEADVERVEGADTEPVTYGIVVENYAYTGATYREGTGHVANNTISNNQITCTANNMYAIEQFGGDNTTIINNTMESTGETAMGIGIIGANSIISNNDITVTGTKETGVTVDYLTAKTAGIVTTRGFNARITDNTISSTFSGIYNTGEINDIIEDNIITCTGDYAIKLQSCNYTTVTNNYLVANEEVGDSAVLTNTQTNIIENNLPLPELIETEITITTEIPEEVELYDLLDIEGYFTANGVKCNFDSIEIFDNGGSLEVIESWDSEGGIYYTYDVEEVGEHELSFVFNGNDTHKETESIILFNVYDPNEKKNSFIDFSLDDSVESGEELEISALMYALDDETPISDAVVLIKVIINDEVVHENQTITDEEGWILYSFDTTGLSGLAKVELIFEGNDHYNEIYASEEIEIIGNKQDVIIMLNVDDEYVEGEDLTVDGTVFTMDDEEAVTGLDITIDVTYSDGTSTSTTVTTDDEGSFTAQLPANVLGEATITASIAENDLYNTTNASETTEIIQKPAANTFLVIAVDSQIHSGDTATITGQLTYFDDNQEEHPLEGAPINIKITIDEAIFQTSNSTDSEGMIYYEFDTTGLDGMATIEFTFEGNEYYLESSATDTIEILPGKQDILLVIESDDEYELGTDIELNGLLSLADNDEPVVGQTVEVTISYSDGTTQSIESTPSDEEGSFSVTLPATVVGQATIFASITDNELYNDVSDTTTTEIVKTPLETSITVDTDNTIYSGDTLEIDGIILYTDNEDNEYALANAPVILKITIDEAITLETTLTTDNEGMISYQFDTTGIDGNALVELIFEGNEEFLYSEDSASVEILPVKQDLFLVIESDDEYELGTDMELSGILTFAEDDEPVIGETLEVTITYSDGTSLTVESTPTDEEGYFTATLPANVIGQASITASISDNEQYNDASDTTTTEIVKTPLETSITVNTDNTIYSGDTLEIDGIILYTDNEDNEYTLANAPVILKITIDEAITLETTLTTDNEGMISYQFDTTGIDGNTLVELIFEGNEDYMASSDNQEVLIKPARKEVTILLECDESYPDNDDMILSGIAYTADDNELPITDTLVYITVTFDDDSVETYTPVTDNEGSFIITVSKDKLVVGNVHILASIEESDLYLESTTEAETEITHETFETLLTVDVESTVNSGDIMQIDGILLYSDEVDEYALAGVPVILKITIDDVITLETTVTTDNEGMISYQFDTTGITGNAIVELIFEGDYDYRSSSDSSAVEIVKVKKNVVMDCLILDEYAIGEEIVVSGTLSVEDEQTPVEGKNVDITIAYYDGSSKTITATTDSDGVFTASFNASVLGTIQVNITSAEDDDYLEAQSELTSYINKIATSLDVNILNTTLGNVTIAVNVYDELDNPLTHGTITVKDADENLLLTVELDGETAIINVPANAEGQIKIMVEYLENDMYLPSIYINQSALETPDEYFVIIEVKGNYQESVVTLDELTAFVNNTCTISATVTDIDGNDIDTGIVEFIDGEGNILGQANVENGVASIDVLYTKELTTQVTATYTSGSEYITDSETTATLTVRKANTIIEIDDVELIAGQTVNLTARVFDEAGNNISVGKVVFKINGKTLKDANGKVLYAKVVNGTTTIEYTVPDELAGAEINITATYSGNSKIPGANTTITTTVNTKGASLTLTSPEEVQVGSTATFTATINDNKVVNNGKVVFKINGKTLKDANGKVIYARIIDNVATIEYTIPESMKAKVYNLTAVLLADEYDRLEATNEIKITN